MPETTVIHVNQAPEGWEKNEKYQYIGRGWSGHREWSQWACRYREKEFEPGLALQKYEDDLMRNLDDANYVKRLKGLYGKTLVCYEKPNHGEILVKWTNRLNNPDPLQPLGPVKHLEYKDVKNAQALFDSWKEFQQIEWQFKEQYLAEIEEKKKEFQDSKALIVDVHDMVALLRPLTQLPPYERYDQWHKWRASCSKE